MKSTDLVRIWSNEHGAWWRAKSNGYASRIEDAGLYERADAERICKEGGAIKGIPCEEIEELNQTLSLMAALQAILDTPDHPMRKKCKDIARAALQKAGGNP